MPTECIPDLFGFEPVERREVVAAFDAGMVTSDAGALLLRATDRAIKMMERFASCFHDVRRAELIEHEVATLVGQRVFGIALAAIGFETARHLGRWPAPPISQGLPAPGSPTAVPRALGVRLGAAAQP